MSITQYGRFWQDKALENRGKMNAKIENVQSPYLNLKIFACNVTQTDVATYLCHLSAIKEEDFSQILPNSEQISLNITGKILCIKYYYFMLALPHHTVFLQC